MYSDRRYEPIRESRDWYFVEYRPPINDDKFATLNLVILKDALNIDIINAMEKEMGNWLNRFPIPLFVSAFDNKGDLYDLSEIKTCNHLIGFFNTDGRISFHWKLLKDHEIPNAALNREFVENLYSNLVFRTNAELDIDRRKRRQKIKLGWFIFFIWLVIIPLIIAFLDYFSDWVSLVALIYSFYKALQKGLELTGRWPKSKRTKEKELEEQLKNHYYYHCQMNPEGFKKVMQENLEKIAKDEIVKESEYLKTGKK
jgi:hypothetical protein